MCVCEREREREREKERERERERESKSKRAYSSCVNALIYIIMFYVCSYTKRGTV